MKTAAPKAHIKTAHISASFSNVFDTDMETRETEICVGFQAKSSDLGFNLE